MKLYHKIHNVLVLLDESAETTSSQLSFDGLYSDTVVWEINYNLKDSTATDADIIYDGGNSQ